MEWLFEEIEVSRGFALLVAVSLAMLWIWWQDHCEEQKRYANEQISLRQHRDQQNSEWNAQMQAYPWLQDLILRHQHDYADPWSQLDQFGVVAFNVAIYETPNGTIEITTSRPVYVGIETEKRDLERVCWKTYGF